MGQVKIELHASALVSVTGNTAAFLIPTLTMASVHIDVTDSNGTTEEMSIWLQVSPDKGTTWYDWPHDQALKDLPTVQADSTVVINGRNINGAAVITGIERHVARYNHLPAGHVRLRWVIDGTTPDFTFSGRLEGK